MKEPKVNVVLPGFWALNEEEQREMLAKMDKMKAERGKKEEEIILTPEQQKEVEMLKEAERNGTLIIEGWEHMFEGDILEDDIIDE